VPSLLIKLSLMLLAWMISAIVVWSGFLIWQGQPASIQDWPLLLVIIGVLAFLLNIPAATPALRMALLLVPWLLAGVWSLSGIY